MTQSLIRSRVGSSHPLPHVIAQLLTSAHFNCNHSICHHCLCRFVVVVLVVVAVMIPSLFVFNYFHPWKCGLPSALGVYARIVVSIGNEGEGHKSSSALAVTIITLEVVNCLLIFLGGG